MLFPILEIHSPPKLRDFFGMCFSSGFTFHLPWFQVWTVTISRNSLVLYLAFLFQIFLRSSSVMFFLASVFAFWELENFRLKSYYFFSWYLLFWFLCFCWGSEPFLELHVCFAFATFAWENKRLRYEQILRLLCHIAECSTTQIECTADSVNMKHPALLFTLVQQHRVEMVNP